MQCETPVVENIIEINILLFDFEFERGGFAAANAIHNGLTVLEALIDIFMVKK